MESVLIPLKLKYRHGQPLKQQKSTGGTSGKNKRNKITAAEKKMLKPQPKITLRIDGMTGRQSWIRQN